MLGSPIAHSLSPALHRAAYAALGLDWRYEVHEVDADGLAAFVAGCDGSWRGLSMTMPLKEAALSLGEVDSEARLVGGANTLVFEPDGRRLFNTDVGGLVAALRAAGVHEVRDAVLIGAGATARSALVSVHRLGARRVRVLARTPSRAATLVALADTLEVDLTVRPWADPAPRSDVVVSTVTASAAAPRAGELAAAAETVLDVVYDPWPTPLAAAAGVLGRRLVSGLDLLVHQAARQVELMTGGSVATEVLAAAGRRALHDRAGAGAVSS